MNFNWKFYLLTLAAVALFVLMHVFFPGMRQLAATAEQQIGIEELNACFLLVIGI